MSSIYSNVMNYFSPPPPPTTVNIAGLFEVEQSSLNSVRGTCVDVTSYIFSGYLNYHRPIALDTLIKRCIDSAACTALLRSSIDWLSDTHDDSSYSTTATVSLVALSLILEFGFRKFEAYTARQNEEEFTRRFFDEFVRNGGIPNSRGNRSVPPQQIRQVTLADVQNQLRNTMGIDTNGKSFELIQKEFKEFMRANHPDRLQQSIVREDENRQAAQATPLSDAEKTQMHLTAGTASTLATEAWTAYKTFLGKA